MDGQQFDRLARTVTSTTSRRSALALLLGGGLAGLQGRSAGAAERCRAARETCTRSRQCCEGLDCRISGRCQYKQDCGGREGDYCEQNGDCCDGFKCRKKQNVCRGCKARDERCQVKADCCAGLQCRNRRCRN